jgi:hypothetical protein
MQADVTLHIPFSGTFEMHILNEYPTGSLAEAAEIAEIDRQGCLWPNQSINQSIITYFVLPTK